MKNDGKCSFIQDIPSPNLSDHCESLGYHLPTWSSKDQVSALFADKLTSYGWHFDQVNAEQINIPLGFKPGLLSKTLNLASGLSLASHPFFNYSSLLNGKMPMLILKDSDSEFSYESSIESSVSICERLTTQYCILSSAWETFKIKLPKPTLKGMLISSSMCILNCKRLAYQETIIMTDVFNNTVCICIDLNEEINLFELQTLFKGNCDKNCQGQLCGNSDSSLVIINENIESFTDDCEEHLMFSGLEPLDNLSNQVDCKYLSTEICQAPLLAIPSLTQVKIDDIEMNPPFIKMWNFEMMNSNDQSILEISFQKLSVVKFIHTAWKIDKLEFSLNKPPFEWSTFENNAGETWTYNENHAMPMDIVLPSPLVIYGLKLSIVKHDQQLSPFLQLRGCILENDAKEESKNSITFIDKGMEYESDIALPESIIDYASAIQHCQSRNGSLVIPDSLEQIMNIRKVMAKHVNKYNFVKPNYIMGLKRSENVWRFANNQPLGAFMPWADLNPVPGLDCITFFIEDNEAIMEMALEWTSYDCDLITKSKIICSRPYDFDMKSLEDSYVQHCLRSRSQDWSFLKEADNEEECKTACLEAKEMNANFNA